MLAVWPLYAEAYTALFLFEDECLGFDEMLFVFCSFLLSFVLILCSDNLYGLGYCHESQFSRPLLNLLSIVFNQLAMGCIIARVSRNAPGSMQLGHHQWKSPIGTDFRLLLVRSYLSFTPVTQQHDLCTKTGPSCLKTSFQEEQCLWCKPASTTSYICLRTTTRGNNDETMKWARSHAN